MTSNRLNLSFKAKKQNIIALTQFTWMKTLSIPCYLDTLSIALFAPHVFEDGIHGSSIVELLFKLMRIT